MIPAMETANQVLTFISGIATLLGGVIVGFGGALWAYTRFVVERGLLPPSQFDVGCKRVGQRGDRQILEVALRIANRGSSTLIVADLHVDLRYATKADDEAAREEILFRNARDRNFGSVRYPRSLLAHDLGFCGRIVAGKEGDLLKVEEQVVRVGKEHVVAVRRKAKDADETKAADEAKAAYETEVVVGTKADPLSGDRPRQKGDRGLPVLRHDTFVQPGVEQTYTLITALPRDATQVLVFGSFRYEVRPVWLHRAALAVARKLGMVQFTLDHVTKPHTAQRAFDLTRPANDGDD